MPTVSPVFQAEDSSPNKIGGEPQSSFKLNASPAGGEFDSLSTVGNQTESNPLSTWTETPENTATELNDGTATKKQVTAKAKSAGSDVAADKALQNAAVKTQMSATGLKESETSTQTLAPSAPPKSIANMAKDLDPWWWLLALIPLMMVLMLFKWITGTSSSSDLDRYRYRGPKVIDTNDPNLRGRFKKVSRTPKQINADEALVTSAPDTLRHNEPVVVTAAAGFAEGSVASEADESEDDFDFLDEPDGSLSEPVAMEPSLSLSKNQQEDEPAAMDDQNEVVSMDEDSDADFFFEDSSEEMNLADNSPADDPAATPAEPEVASVDAAGEEFQVTAGVDDAESADSDLDFSDEAEDSFDLTQPEPAASVSDDVDMFDDDSDAGFEFDDDEDEVLADAPPAMEQEPVPASTIESIDEAQSSLAADESLDVEVEHETAASVAKTAAVAGSVGLAGAIASKLGGLFRRSPKTEPAVASTTEAPAVATENPLSAEVRATADTEFEEFVQDSTVAVAFDDAEVDEDAQLSMDPSAGGDDSSDGLFDDDSDAGYQFDSNTTSENSDDSSEFEDIWAEDDSQPADEFAGHDVEAQPALETAAANIEEEIEASADESEFDFDLSDDEGFSLEDSSEAIDVTETVAATEAGSLESADESEALAESDFDSELTVPEPEQPALAQSSADNFEEKIEASADESEFDFDLSDDEGFSLEDSSEAIDATETAASAEPVSLESPDEPDAFAEPDLDSELAVPETEQPALAQSLVEQDAEPAAETFTELSDQEFKPFVAPSANDELPLLEDQLLDKIVAADGDAEVEAETDPASELASGSTKVAMGLAAAGLAASSLMGGSSEASDSGELHDRIAELESANSRLQDDLQQAQQLLKSQKQTEAEELASAEAQAKEQALATAEAESSLKSELEESQEQLEKLKAENATLAEQVASSELEMQKASEQESAAEETQQRLADLETELASAGEQNTELQAKLANADQEKVAAQEALEAAVADSASANTASEEGMPTGSLFGAAGGSLSAVAGSTDAEAVAPESAGDDPFRLEPEQVKVMLKKLKLEKKKRQRTKEYLAAAEQKRKQVKENLSNVTAELESLKQQLSGKDAAGLAPLSESSDEVAQLRAELDAAKAELKKKMT